MSHKLKKLLIYFYFLWTCTDEYSLTHHGAPRYCSTTLWYTLLPMEFPTFTYLSASWVSVVTFRCDNFLVPKNKKKTLVRIRINNRSFASFSNRILNMGLRLLKSNFWSKAIQNLVSYVATKPNTLISNMYQQGSQLSFF